VLLAAAASFGLWA